MHPCLSFQSVQIRSLTHALPDEIVTSDSLEERMQSVYDSLGLHVGRLELMSGIRERRFWPAGTRPSEVAARAGSAALAEAGMAPEKVGCLIHSSVCRDFMEPATASVVHARLGLSPHCQAFDLSNACLGFSNAMVVAAGMIESGQIEAALVVAGEDGRPLVEETLADLNGRDACTRDEVKRAYASLTIGSGAAACVLTRSASDPGSHPRLIAGVGLSATEHYELCSGDHTDGNGPLMETDSEALLQAGVALAQETWVLFQETTGWGAESVDRFITHQVGRAHKRALFEALGLDHGKDFTTVETLGNMGSVSLPATLALAVEEGFIQSGQRVALQGIGSGLQCQMLALEW